MCCRTPRREWATPTPTKDFQDFLLESKIIFAHCGVASGRRELVKVPVLSQQCCANPQQPEVFPTQLKDVTKHWIETPACSLSLKHLLTINSLLWVPPHWKFRPARGSDVALHSVWSQADTHCIPISIRQQRWHWDTADKVYTDQGSLCRNYRQLE